MSATQPYRRSRGDHPLWIAGLPAPDSWRSLRQATCPQLLHHHPGRDLAPFGSRPRIPFTISRLEPAMASPGAASAHGRRRVNATKQADFLQPGAGHCVCPRLRPGCSSPEPIEQPSNEHDAPENPKEPNADGSRPTDRAAKSPNEPESRGKPGRTEPARCDEPNADKSPPTGRAVNSPNTPECPRRTGRS